ncbi:MAG: monovalent cation/H+ antiporter subunit D [Deltaproteobacteria bacterium]|nr:monovalent cation/H+ antiporter subunit D [Deltaproteobacteria bacterium]
MNHWLTVPLVLPLIAGMINLLLVRRNPALQRVVSLLTTVSLLVAAVILWNLAAAGAVEVYALGHWPAPFGIVLVLDRLSALMLLTTAILALPVLIHATHMDDTLSRDFHVFFPLQLLGLNGAFLTGDLFNLFVFFEILLIASYCLALHGFGPARTRSSLHYVILNLVGSSLFLLALGTVYGVCGTLNMAHLAARAAEAPPESAWLLSVASLLLLTVFGLKSAIAPLFLWLPRLYASVLPSVAALFAIMTKVGVYAILRTQSLIFPPDGPGAEAAGLVLPLALVTLGAGALAALGSHRLRSLLAHLVIVSVGTLLTGIGLWNADGIAAALFYLPHTTLVTAGLFLLADVTSRQRGDLDDRLEPGPQICGPALIGGLFVLGAAAAAGLPPLSGFIAKVLLLRAAGTGMESWVWPVVLSGGLIGIVTLSRAGSTLFWNSPGPCLNVETGWARLAPATVLILAGVALAVLAEPLAEYTRAAALQLLDPQAYVLAVIPEASP